MGGKVHDDNPNKKTQQFISICNVNVARELVFLLSLAKPRHKRPRLLSLCLTQR